MLKAAKAYFETQVATTSQGDLLIMLYDGAINFLQQAKIKIEAKDYAEKGILISKTIDIVSELDESLNPDKGGEVAQNLHQLYFYCNTRLLRANMTMDLSLIDEVIKILGALRDAFTRIKGTVPEPNPEAKLAPTPPKPTVDPELTAPGTSTEESGQKAVEDGNAPPAALEAEATEPQSPPLTTAASYGPKLVKKTAPASAAPIKKPGLPGAYAPPRAYR